MAVPAAAAASGFNPYITGGSLLASLIAGLAHGQSKGFQFRQFGRDLEEQYNPQKLIRDAMRIYSSFSRSPVAGNLRSRATRTGAIAGNAIARQQAESFGTTGNDLIQTGVAAALPSSLLSEIDAKMFESSLGEASGLMRARLGAQVGGAGQTMGNDPGLEFIRQLLGYSLQTQAMAGVR